MFPTANISCGLIENVSEVDRNLLVENEWVYYINTDSTLQRVDLKPIRWQEKSVITDQLPDGMQVLSKNIPGAFIGMKVRPQLD